MNQSFLKGTFTELKFMLKLDQSLNDPARKTQKPSKKFLTKLDQGTCDPPKKTAKKVFLKKLWKLEKGVSMACLMSTYYQVTFIKFFWVEIFVIDALKYFWSYEILELRLNIYLCASRWGKVTFHKSFVCLLLRCICSCAKKSKDKVRFQKCQMHIYFITMKKLKI